MSRSSNQTLTISQIPKYNNGLNFNVMVSPVGAITPENIVNSLAPNNIQMNGNSNCNSRSEKYKQSIDVNVKNKKLRRDSSGSQSLNNLPSY